MAPSPWGSCGSREAGQEVAKASSCTLTVVLDPANLHGPLPHCWGKSLSPQDGPGFRGLSKLSAGVGRKFSVV